jgi:hypothetical protein
MTTKELDTYRLAIMALHAGCELRVQIILDEVRCLDLVPHGDVLRATLERDISAQILAAETATEARLAAAAVSS